MTLLLALLAAVPPAGGEAPTLAPPYAGRFGELPVSHWSVPLPGGVRTSSAASERALPVLVDASIFVGSSSADKLFELERTGGSVIREFDAAAPVQSAPLVMADRVYFSDTGGHTWCYSRAGDLKWFHDGKVPILAHPTVDGDLAFVATVDDLVFGLDAETGELRWRYQHRADVTRRSEMALYATPAPVVMGDEVLVGFSDGAVVGLSRDAGDIQWSMMVGEGQYPDIVGQPSPGPDGMAFVSGYFEPLFAVDLTSHHARWTFEVGSAASALVVDLTAQLGSSIVYHPGTDGRLRALDAATGDLRWEWNSDTDGALTTPRRVDSGILVGSTSGTLWLIDALTGKELWHFAPPFVLEGLAGPPAVDGRQLVFTTNAGWIYSLLSPAEVYPWNDPGWRMQRRQVPYPIKRKEREPRVRPGQPEAPVSAR